MSVRIVPTLMQRESLALFRLICFDVRLWVRVQCSYCALDRVFWIVCRRVGCWKLYCDLCDVTERPVVPSWLFKLTLFVTTAAAAAVGTLDLLVWRP